MTSRTRHRVGELARRLEAATQQEVIDRALDKLEESLFWEGFDDEAKEYLKKHPQEQAERDTFGRTSADGMRRGKVRR